MKTVLLFFILVWSLALQGQHNSSLKITIIDCSNTVDNWFFPALTIYKLPEDTIYLGGVKTYAKNGIIEIASFVPGTYRFEYNNAFGERVKKLHVFEACDKNEIRICLDDPEIDPGNYLQALPGNDSIVIDFSSISCYTRSWEKLVITNKGKYYQAKIYPTRTRFSLFKEEPVSKEPEIITLTEKNIHDFKEFENGLNHFKKGARCTATGYYIVTAKWGVKEVIDGGCQWGGFGKLKKSILDND